MTKWGSGNTYAITLPIEWVKLYSITPGMEIRMEIRDDGTIVLSPPSHETRKSITIPGETIKDRDHLRNLVIGHFIEGYDVIKIEYPILVPPAILEEVDIIREKMLGFVVEKRDKSVEFSELMKIESLQNLRKHYYNRIISYIDKFAENVPKNNTDLLQDLVYEPDEILAMYYRCVREVNKIKPSAADILFMKSLMMIVEELDGLLNAYSSLKTEIPQAFIESLQLISESVKLLVDTALFGDVMRTLQVRNKLEILEGDVQSVREWGTMDAFVGYLERISRHIEHAMLYSTIIAQEKIRRK